MNGNKEYSYTIKDITFYIPEGLRHYYTEHNVHPSDKFRKFVEDVSNI